jgi:hypothetical protein
VNSSTPKIDLRRCRESRYLIACTPSEVHRRRLSSLHISPQTPRQQEHRHSSDGQRMCMPVQSLSLRIHLIPHVLDIFPEDGLDLLRPSLQQHLLTQPQVESRQWSVHHRRSPPEPATCRVAILRDRVIHLQQATIRVLESELVPLTGLPLDPPLSTPTAVFLASVVRNGSLGDRLVRSKPSTNPGCAAAPSRTRTRPARSANIFDSAGIYRDRSYEVECSLDWPRIYAVT